MNMIWNQSKHSEENENEVNVMKKKESKSRGWKYILVDIVYPGKEKAGIGSRDASAIVGDNVSADDGRRRSITDWCQ